MTSLPNFQSKQKPRKVVTLESIPLLSKSEQSRQGFETPGQLIARKAKRPEHRDAAPAPKGWKGKIAVFCNSEMYKTTLTDFLKNLKEFTLIDYGDVLHLKQENDKNIFIFPYGVTVFWGFTIREEADFLMLLEPYLDKPLLEVEYDGFDFSYSEATKFSNDEVILENGDPLVKLAISHGLAQSIKISTFDRKMDQLIEETKMIPEELTQDGRISLSSSTIGKLMGRVLNQRNLVNIHADVLDVPEFFWQHPDLEKYYHQTTTYLDVKQRSDALDKRLETLKDLIVLLTEELNTRHISSMDWVIIILIAVEIVLDILHTYFEAIEDD